MWSPNLAAQFFLKIVGFYGAQFLEHLKLITAWIYEVCKTCTWWYGFLCEVWNDTGKGKASGVLLESDMDSGDQETEVESEVETENPKQELAKFK